MANTPKKIKDPTEAALTARDAAVESEAASPPAAQATPAEEPVAEPPWRTMRPETPVEAPRLPEEELRPPEEPDRESIGQILRSLQRRPAHTSYITATVFAGL